MKIRSIILTILLFAISIPNGYSAEIEDFFNETFGKDTKPKIFTDKEIAQLREIAIKDKEILPKYILPRFNINELNLETLIREHLEANNDPNQYQRCLIIMCNSPLFNGNKILLHQKVNNLKSNSFEYNIDGLIFKLENILYQSNAVSLKLTLPNVDKSSGIAVTMEKTFGEKLYLANDYTPLAYLEVARKIDNKVIREKYLILIYAKD